MAVRSAMMVLAFCVALLSWPLPSTAQPPGKIHRIGLLLATSPEIAVRWIVIGRSAPREVGYVEGANLVIEYRYASGQYELLPVHTAELVKLNVDLIVALGDITIEAARQVTRTTPIVMISGGDPVGSGFVASLARPGGNVTGVASLIPDINPKMLSLLKEAVPRATRIGVLWNPGSRGGVLGYKGMQEAARGLGVTLSSYETRRGVDFDGVFASSYRGDGRPDGPADLQPAGPHQGPGGQVPDLRHVRDQGVRRGRRPDGIRPQPGRHDQALGLLRGQDLEGRQAG